MYIVNGFQCPGIASALDCTKTMVHEDNIEEGSDLLSEDEDESDEDILVLSD